VLTPSSRKGPKPAATPAKSARSRWKASGEVRRPPLGLDLMLPLRRLEIRRHAAKGSELGGDCLSQEGIEQAHRLGRSLRVGYTHLYSSGAQRATQTLACILAGMGRHVLRGVVVRPGLGSPREAEWRDTARAAGSTSLEKLLSQNEPLVRDESARLATELRAILADMPAGAYGLAIGHSPLIECGVYGLTRQEHAPLRECEGVVIAELPEGRLQMEEMRLGAISEDKWRHRG
jgi:histidine phosphatase superfamily protein (branch 1)